MDSAGRYENAIEKIVADMREEFGADLLGMLLGGSVAYGIPCRRSDLDIYVIIRPSWRQRRTVVVGDVEVELFINPVHRIRKEFKDVDHDSTFAMFAQGRILYDPDGVMATLVKEAREVWEQPRPALPPDALPLLRYIPTDVLKDAQDLAETDEVAANYLIFMTLQATLDAYYKIQRRWPVKPKHLLRDLHGHAPDIEQAVRQILSGEGSAEERCVLLSRLVEQVLEPVGGLLGEWESVPEQLPDAETVPEGADES
ncbi:MAG: hypothetical protein AB1774_09395 [Bacillota bacterium]